MINIFISHSSKDVEIINYIKDYFNKIDIEPIILDDVIEGLPPPQKILKNLKNCDIFLMVWTKNVYESEETKAILNHEISIAFALDLPIFAIIEKSVDKPRYFDNLTDYKRYNDFNDFKIQLEKFRSTFENLRDEIIRHKSLLELLKKRISLPSLFKVKKRIIGGK